jgi:cytochrome P450
MAGQLVGWQNALVLLQYGDRFRRHRKYFHRYIGISAVTKLQPIQITHTRTFLRSILQSPDDLAKHIRHTAGSIILRISHGYDTRPSDDPLVQLADKATAELGIAITPGAFLVELIPARSSFFCFRLIVVLLIFL